MNIVIICIIYAIGLLMGYISSSIFNANKHEKECIKAFENGKAFERMRITKTYTDDHDI